MGPTFPLFRPACLPYSLSIVTWTEAFRCPLSELPPDFGGHNEAFHAAIFTDWTVWISLKVEAAGPASREFSFAAFSTQKRFCGMFGGEIYRTRDWLLKCEAFNIEAHRIRFHFNSGFEFRL